MEKSFFYHPKTAIVCAASPLRTENGRPLGAEVAHMQMMRMPTCRLTKMLLFFFSFMVGADSPVHGPYLPATRTYHGHDSVMHDDDDDVG